MPFRGFRVGLGQKKKSHLSSNHGGGWGAWSHWMVIICQRGSAEKKSWGRLLWIFIHKPSWLDKCFCFMTYRLHSRPTFLSVYFPVSVFQINLSNSKDIIPTSHAPIANMCLLMYLNWTFICSIKNLWKAFLRYKSAISGHLEAPYSKFFSPQPQPWWGLRWCGFSNCAPTPPFRQFLDPPLGITHKH